MVNNALPVHVAGEVTVDWKIVAPDIETGRPLEQRYVVEEHSAIPTMTANPGGAALVTSIVRHAAATSGRHGGISGPSVSEQALIDPNDATILRTASIWRQFPRGDGDRQSAWRMSRFLGWQPAIGRSSPASVDRELPDSPSNLLVFEDLGMSFRDDPAQWESLLLEQQPESILVNQTRNLARGALWERLIQQFADRLTLVCTVGDLRKEGAPIGRPLSWERTALDVWEAVQARPDLTAASRVIVLLAISGAIIVERTGTATLVYDPAHQEGDWERSRPGLWYGAAPCVVSSLILAMAEAPVKHDAGAALGRGFTAARALHDGGFDIEEDSAGGRIRFPYPRVASILSQPSPDDASFICAEIGRTPQWRLLETADSKSFREVADLIALVGEKAATRAVPIERMGAWMSVDRSEVESIRSVRNIITEYLANLAQSRRAKPLNLAVFGPPGSGKSFAIKELAKELSRQGPNLSILEFNVSQFPDEKALPEALQRVRDRALEQTLPLVFWDEFDSTLGGKELGWLVRFLAPMQDGAFAERGITRPIGPAIFVFAGGTHATMESFKQRAVDMPATKATDFLSRLRGFVNILGPNPDGSGDMTYPLRRAMLLRSILQRRAPHLFADGHLRIDRHLLDAFLDVPAYVHGSRSMESIVEMSALSGALRFERSALPAAHQLELHVDAGSFMAIVDGR